MPLLVDPVDSRRSPLLTRVLAGPAVPLHRGRVAGINRNRRPVSARSGGRFAPDWVADFSRNTHQLAPTLKAHDVDVTGVGQGSGLLTDLLSFLPLLLFVAFFIVFGRRNAKQWPGRSWASGGRGPTLRRGQAHDALR